MPNARADRDLLFGILALQNNFITREQLLSAFDSWVVNKDRSIGKVLLAQKALTDDEHALLDGLANKHIARHGGNAEKSLAAVSSLDSVRRDLEKIADSDLQASVGHLPPLPQGEGRGEGLDSRASDDHATAAPTTIGLSTSTGLRFREDLQRYAKMLEEVSVRFPGTHVTQPLTPQAAPAKPAQETHI